jgi:hypothetical protein
MSRSRLPAVALLACLLLAATSNKAKVHGYDLTGTITGLDQSKKTLIVQNAEGKQTKLSWTNATKVVGGPLALGQSVTLRYLDKDGKHIVASIRVGHAETPTVGVALAPTAKPTAAR